IERALTRLHAEDRGVLRDALRHAQAGHDTDFELRLSMPDGRVKHLHFRGRALRDPKGRLEYVGAAQDITGRKGAELALDKVRSDLARTTRAVSLGVLAASIAHEVNQPLSGIVTNASTCLRMLAADPPNLDGARATAQRTLRDGNRASDVIQHLRGLFA